MRERLKAACEEGVIIGVKWGIVALLSLTGAGLAIGDYALTRAKANQGAGAAEFIQRQLDAQQKAAQPQVQGVK